MKQRAAPLPQATTVTPAGTGRAAGASSCADEARARSVSDETAAAILECVRWRLNEVAACTQAEDQAPDTTWSDAATHAPYGAARLPSTSRWGAVAEAWRAVAASVARGDLAQAVSRLRHAEQLEDDARRSAPWALPPVAVGIAPWRTQVPRVFATPRDVPPDIDALADRIAHREGATRRPGVRDDLHPRPPAAPESDDDLE